MADRVAHLSYLAIAPLANRNRQRGVSGFAPGQLDVGRRRPASLDHHAAREPGEIARIGQPEHARLVDARHAVAGMGEPRREVAVIGQYQQAFRFEIQPPDRIDILPHAVDQIQHGRPALRIRSRGDVAAGLVEQEVAMVFGHLHPAAVHTDVVARCVGFRAELAHAGAVDRHAALQDQLLGRAARGDARLRDDFLKAFHGPIYTRDVFSATAGPPRNPPAATTRRPAACDRRPGARSHSSSAGAPASVPGPGPPDIQLRETG